MILRNPEAHFPPSNPGLIPIRLPKSRTADVLRLKRKKKGNSSTFLSLLRRGIYIF
jgi:hypothetical protein